MNISSYSDPIDRQEFVNEMADRQSAYSALETIALEKKIGESKEDLTLKESPSVDAFFERPLNSPEDTSFKKIIAAASIIGKKYGLINLDNMTSEQIGSAICSSVEQAKVNYKAGNGELNVIEASDKLIDLAAAKAVTALDKAIEVGLPIAADKIAQVVVSAYPPAAVAAPFFKVAIAKASPAIKQLAHTGISRVAEKAKSFIREAIPALKATGKILLSKIFS